VSKLIKTLYIVYQNHNYLLLTLSIVFLVVSGVAWYQNWHTATLVLAGPLAVVEKIQFVGWLYIALGTMFSVTSLIVLFTIAILFAVHTSLLVHYIRKVRGGSQGTKRLHATSVTGMVAGLFGIGCAACGSIIISAFFASFGASGLLLILPWHGQEFGVLGVGLLLVSNVFLLRKIADPLVCVAE